MEIKIESDNLPGLYKSANNTSMNEQKKYFNGIRIYISLLVLGAGFAYFAENNPNSITRIFSALSFLASLGIIIWLRVSKPDDTWHKGRSVAETVKTLAWLWMLRAEPYEDNPDRNGMRNKFVKDLKSILEQNQNLIGKLCISSANDETITKEMVAVRSLNIKQRIDLYKRERITAQTIWYTKKSKHNRNKSNFWFIVTIVLYSLTITFLLYNIKEPNLKFPIQTIAVATSGVLTWIQSKRYNELYILYTLTAHKILLIKEEISRIETEKELSKYIKNFENIFSKELTQWILSKK